MPIAALPAAAEKLDYLYIHNPDNNIKPEGISFDSRLVRPGHIFVAIKGERYDGHRFIQEALSKGAEVVIAEEPPPADHRGTWIHVGDSRLALAQLAAVIYGHPSRELFLVGVTGTCGKTTTSTILQKIYETAGIHTGLVGTVNICCGGQTWPASMTTPDALQTQKLMRLMVDSGVTHAAMEVSSHSLVQKRVEAVEFSGAVFTNVSPNHLDFHRTLEGYIAAKKMLAEHVNHGGFVLSNSDDPVFCRLNVPNNVSLFFFGRNSSSDFRITDLYTGREGSYFKLHLKKTALLEKKNAGKSCFQFYTPLVGEHNIYNAAAAASAALLSGIAGEHVYNGLAFFRGVERRMQFYRFNGVQVIDDKAMNPGGIDAVFKALQGLSCARPVVVYAVRGSRGTRVNEDNGRALAGWIRALKIEHFFSTSSYGSVKDRDRVFPEEEEAFLRGARSAGASPVHCGKLPEAVSRAVNAAVPGSTILLLGSRGMDKGLDILKKEVEFLPV